MSYRSRKDGTHYPIRGRSLYGHAPKNQSYSRNIHFANPTEAKSSVIFANERWRALEGRRTDRVKLLQAMNEAANRAKAETENKRVGSEDHRKASEAYTVLRAWVDGHKGRESAQR